MKYSVRHYIDDFGHLLIYIVTVTLRSVLRRFVCGFSENPHTNRLKTELNVTVTMYINTWHDCASMWHNTMLHIYNNMWHLCVPGVQYRCTEYRESEHFATIVRWCITLCESPDCSAENTVSHANGSANSENEQMHHIVIQSHSDINTKKMLRLDFHINWLKCRHMSVMTQNVWFDDEDLRKSDPSRQKFLGRLIMA